MTSSLSCERNHEHHLPLLGYPVAHGFVKIPLTEFPNLQARLAPFFQLPGVVVSTLQTVSVELRPFNDRQYNRDLITLCQRVNEQHVRLPDGRLLVFSVKEICRPILHGQKRQIA